jgi:hypothetical protein
MTTPPMTPSPESRAREIVSRALAVDAAVNLGTEYLESLIASAIRDAENDKLEEAAVAAESAPLGMSCFVDSADCRQFNFGVRHAVGTIRSLKSKD